MGGRLGAVAEADGLGRVERKRGIGGGRWENRLETATTTRGSPFLGNQGIPAGILATPALTFYPQLPAAVLRA